MLRTINLSFGVKSVAQDEELIYPDYCIKDT